MGSTDGKEDMTLGRQKPVCADEVVSAQLDLANAVLFGRQDYAVRSIDAVLGHEKWNVTYAQLDVLTPPRLAAGARADNDRLLAPAGSDALDAGITHVLCFLTKYQMSISYQGVK